MRIINRYRIKNKIVKKCNKIQKYCKGVGRATGARVQIPLSPLEILLFIIKKEFQKKLKKVVDKLFAV